MEQEIQNSGDADAEGENTIAFREAYNEYLKLVERLLLGTQAAQQTIIRLLLTLSSGSLLASISLLRSWVNVDTVWLALLPVAWGFLGLSVFACLVYLGNYNPHGYDFIVAALKAFTDEAEELTGKVSSLSTKEKAAAVIKLRLEQLAARPEVTREDAWIVRTGIVARAGFFLGLLALIAFAIRNLPWNP